MKAKKKKTKKGSFLETYRSIRKPMPPATKVINPKKYDRHDRQDKSWEDEI